jgi:hypothetical protein
MGKDRQIPGPLAVQLENYDFTRKTIAVQNLDILTGLIRTEAAKEAPDLAAIAVLANSVAALLSAVT